MFHCYIDASSSSSSSSSLPSTPTLFLSLSKINTNIFFKNTQSMPSAFFWEREVEGLLQGYFNDQT